MQQRQMIFFLLAGLCSGWVAPLGVRSVPYHIGTLPESTMTPSSNDSSPALPLDLHPHPIEGTWVLQSIYPGDLKSHRQLADTFTDIFKHHPMTVTVQGNNKTSNEIEFNLRMDVLGARIDGCGSLEVSCASYYTLYIHSIRPVSPPWNIPFRRRALQDIMSILPRIRRFQKTGLRVSFTFLPLRRRLLVNAHSSSLLFQKKLKN
jgi:hypothetical protein